VQERPLSGWRILVTRPEHQSAGLIERLRTLGADPITYPTIAIAPPTDFAALDAAIDRLAAGAYDWTIFTSVNGVRALAERVGERRRGRLAGGGDRAADCVRPGYPMPPGLKIGALGPATGAASAAQGWMPCFVPTEYVAEALVAEIGDVAGDRILLLRADLVREALAAGLRERGARVDEVTAYRTIPGHGASDVVAPLRAGRVAAVTFTSSSTVRFFLDGLGAAGLDRAQARAALARTLVVCIGPVTADTARSEGLRVDAVPREYTIDGLVEALVGLSGRPRRVVGVGR
jgi:uroporphyrinogen III methyltransferase / synthase